MKRRISKKFLPAKLPVAMENTPGTFTPVAESQHVRRIVAAWERADKTEQDDILDMLLQASQIILTRFTARN